MAVCIAMLKLIRNDLLSNDFATNMKLLQVDNYLIAIYNVYTDVLHLGVRQKPNFR